MVLSRANRPNLESTVLGGAIAPGTLINSWVSENAAFIRSLDPNHMVRSPARQARLRAARTPLTLSAAAWQRPAACTGGAGGAAAVLSWLAACSSERECTRGPVHMSQDLCI